jgi:putative nucleotidyltransferase with HDIG domain
MRRKSIKRQVSYKILIVDDEIGIIDSLTVVLGRHGYRCEGLTDPVKAIQKLREEHYDMLILDYIMQPIHGDKVVEKVREFNNDLYILLLTGHKDLAPPLDTIKKLEIQGYCEKSDRFDQLLLLVESGIKSINQMKTIKVFRDGLNKILEAVPKIYQLQPIGNILEEILSKILPLVNSTDAFILVDDTTSNEKKSIFKGIGKFNGTLEDFVGLLGPETMERIGFARANNEIIKHGNSVILPLNGGSGRCMGVIYVECNAEDEGLKLLKIFAVQAASSLNNAFLHSMVNVKNEELKNTYELLRIRYMDTIEALRLAVDAKDMYTRGHSDRVAYYCVKIGEKLNLPESDIELLRISGIFHDIGKIGTNDDILLKNDKLTEEEYDEVKKHSLKGAHILSAVSMFKDVVPIVKHHHERVDGSGYPSGLKGDEAPFLARIVSVADSFDAMMSDRSYRSKLNLEEAKAQLIKNAGTQFDKRVVDAFIELLEDKEGDFKIPCNSSLNCNS